MKSGSLCKVSGPPAVLATVLLAALPPVLHAVFSLSGPSQSHSETLSGTTPHPREDSAFLSKAVSSERSQVEWGGV